MIVTLFIDESGTHADAPVTVMGGYIAKLGQWYEFEKKWRSVLTRHGLTHLHMRDILQRRGEFKKFTPEAALKLTMETEKIVRKHVLFGCTAFVTDDDYRNFYAAGEKPKKIPLDTKYGFCFRLVLSFAAKKVYEALQRDDLSLNVVLESGAKNAGDAVRIFNLFRTDAPPELAQMAGQISFGDKKKFAGLQVADGIATSVYHLERDGEAYGTFHPANAYEEPLKYARSRADGYAPVFRIEATEKLLREMRENVFIQIETRRQFGARRPGGVAQ